MCIHKPSTYQGTNKQRNKQTNLWDLHSHLFSGYSDCFVWLKRPERDVNYSPASSAEVKNEWSYTSTPHYIPSWRWQGRLLTTRLLANKFMEQSVLQCLFSSAGNKYIPRIIWNSQIHHHIHNSPSLLPVLGHMNPVYAFHHVKIHLNIILYLQCTLNTFAQTLCCPLLYLQ
jgi:hypothetical protein